VSLTELAMPTSRRRIGVLVACVLVLGLSLTWAFFSMRAVMDVGGSCADGGPDVSAQPCSGGAVLIAFAIPLMIIAAMVGSAVALSVSAPNLLIPMWAVLFASLGWNFLEFGFPPDSNPVWGWVVCGIVFWAMAAPAFYVIFLGLRSTLSAPTDTPSRPEARKWWVVYPVLGAAGVALGVLSFNALS
jgi:hypothetical protein